MTTEQLRQKILQTMTQQGARRTILPTLAVGDKLPLSTTQYILIDDIGAVQQKVGSKGGISRSAVRGLFTADEHSPQWAAAIRQFGVLTPAGTALPLSAFVAQHVGGSVHIACTTQLAAQARNWESYLVLGSVEYNGGRIPHAFTLTLIDGTFWLLDLAYDVAVHLKDALMQNGRTYCEADTHGVRYCLS